MRLFRVKGEITVFLALILSITLSFLCIVFESARVSSIKQQIEVSMDASLRSCFGEYNIKLFELYDLLYIDSSYKAGTADVINVSNHISAYMKENLDFDSNNGGLDYFKLDVMDAKVQDMLLASDYGGLAVYAQANKYLKEYGNTSHVGRIQGICQIMSATDGSSLYGPWDNVLSSIASFGVPFYNPSDTVRGLSIFASDQLLGARNKSLRSLPYSDVPSKRSLKKGNYAISPPNEDMVYTEYLLQKCSSYASPKDYAHLSCELEYLVCGLGSDYQNIKEIINRLIRIFALNIYDSLGHRTAEIKAYAEILVPPPVVPDDPAAWILREELVNLTAMSLRYAWAEAEAILKVDRLLGGGRVSAANPSGDMIAGLVEMPGYVMMLGGSGGSGYTYEEFLSAFIMSSNKNLLRQRFLDLLEINIKKSGSSGFEIDGAIEYLRAIVICDSIGKEHNITREYAYEKAYKKTY